MCVHEVVKKVDILGLISTFFFFFEVEVCIVLVNKCNQMGSH